MAFLANLSTSYDAEPKETSTTFYTSSRAEAVLIAVLPTLTNPATRAVKVIPLKRDLKDLLIEEDVFCVVFYKPPNSP